jgi:hypothetical protein
MSSIKSLFMLISFVPSALAGAQRLALHAAKKVAYTPPHALLKKSTQQYDSAEVIGVLLSLPGGAALGSVGGLLTTIAVIRAGNLPPARTDEEICARHNLTFGFTCGGALTGGHIAMKIIGLMPKTRAVALATGTILVALRACTRDAQKSCF